MIRAAIPADLAAVVRIAKVSFTGEDAFGPGWLLKSLEYSGVTLVVEDASAGVIRGFMMLGAHPLGTIVRLIAVDTEYRGQGVGKALLASVQSPAFAWVRDENTASLNLFKSMLWKETEPVSGRKRRNWRYLSLEHGVD